MHQIYKYYRLRSSYCAYRYRIDLDYRSISNTTANDIPGVEQQLQISSCASSQRQLKGHFLPCIYNHSYKRAIFP